MNQKINTNEIPLFVWAAAALLVSCFLPWASTFVGTQDAWDLIDKGMTVLNNKWASKGDGRIFLSVVTLIIIGGTGPLVLAGYFNGRLVSSAIIGFFGGLIGIGGIFIFILHYFIDNAEARALSFFVKPGYGVYVALLSSIVMLKGASMVLREVRVGKKGIVNSTTTSHAVQATSVEDVDTQSNNHAFTMPQVSKESIQKPLEIIQLGADEFQELIKQNGLYAFAGGIGLGALAMTQPWLAGAAIGGAVVGCGIKKKNSLNEIPTTTTTKDTPRNDDQSPTP